MLVSGAFAVFGIFLLSSASEGTDPSYVIVAPETIRPGLKSRISVTILKADQDVTVQLDLTASNADGVLSSTQATILPGTSKILELMMPIDLPSTYGTYALNATGSGGLTFSNSTTVQVNSKCMSVFIQTDKGIYKPGQTVQMRIIAYKPSLLPFSGNVTVTVMDPNTNLVANWLDVVVTEGVAKREFPLSIEPPVGTWKIKVTGDCASQEKTFTVDKYVLPKFSVTVNPPTYVLTSNKQIQGTVSAKYTYGKPVQGSLHLTFSLPNQYRWTSKSVSDEQVVLTQTYKIDGTAAFSVNSTLIAKLASTQISSDTPSLPSYGSLAINASVTETLTGITLDGYAVSQFFEYPINVAFHESTPETFKPGLPFTGRVVISTPDKKPVLDSEGLKIKISTTIHNSTSSATSINKYPVIGGQVVFTEDIPAGTTSLSFRAFYKYGSHKIDAFRYPSVSKSPSNSFMQLTSHSSNVEPGQKAVYELKSTFILKTIHYQVMARGNIISQSTHTVEGANTATVLEVLLTVDMAPSARLLVYTVLDDGEVVADSLTISVANAFQNKVNVSFSSLESKPGDSVSVSVLASPGSYVGILAVDYSITLLAGGNDISQSAVTDELQSYDTTTPAWYGGPIWFAERRRRSIWWPWTMGGVDAYSIFENSGVVVMSDANVYREQQFWPYPLFDYGFQLAAVTALPPEAAQDLEKAGASDDLVEPVRVRKYFPETWLWVDATASPNGVATVSSTVPDTITSWVATAFAIQNQDGLGVTPYEAKLRAFQPFFVSLNLPYSVIRGEQLALEVQVFNYLDSDLGVYVSLDPSTKLTSVLSNVLEAEETEFTLSTKVEVSANNAVTVKFVVWPIEIGEIPIRVTARSSVAADAVERVLLVEPEGKQLEYTKNVFIHLNETETHLEKTLSLSLPDDVIPNSAKAIVNVIGDLLGPTLSNVEQIVRLPSGCGEQNAASFAPNIYVRQYLEAINQLTPDLTQKTDKYMMTGYQRELNYKHSDGSYSAWGERDETGSLWLTAFVTKLYAQALSYIAIDPDQMKNSLEWIISQQSKDGKFPEIGRIVDTFIKGGLEGDTSRTAFVLISLLEAKKALNFEIITKGETAIAKARSYLETQISTTTNNYTLAVMTYALVLSGSSRAGEAMSKLKAVAISKDGSIHWTDSDQTLNVDDRMWWYYPYHAPAADIEMTGYALLAMVENGDIISGLPVAKWLSQQRNSLGGWTSTQDTCVALQALAGYATLIHGEGSSVSVQLRSSGNEGFSHVFFINEGNAMVLQQAEAPAGYDLQVSATGSGTALVQAVVSYHVGSHVRPKPPYVVSVSVKETDNKIVITACASYQKNKTSGMAVVSGTLPSGYAADEDALNEFVNSNSVGVTRYEVNNRHVDLYLEEFVYNKETCTDIAAYKQYDVGKIKAVPVTVYSYYEPDLDTETAFYVPSDAENLEVCDVCDGCEGCGSGSGGITLTYSILFLILAAFSAVIA